MFALLAQRFSRSFRLLSTIKLVCQAYTTHFVFLGNFPIGQTATKAGDAGGKCFFFPQVGRTPVIDFEHD
jgi:hypothetical protein